MTLSKSKKFTALFSSVVLSQAINAQSFDRVVLPDVLNPDADDACLLEIKKTSATIFGLTRAVCLDDIDNSDEIMAIVTELKDEIAAEAKELSECLTPFCGCWLG